MKIRATQLRAPGQIVLTERELTLGPEDVLVKGHLSGQTFKALLRSMRDYFPELWGYTVWGGIFSTRGFKIIDISAVAGLKRKAIRMHKSQIAYKAYDAGILGRNRYEAVFSDTHKPARHSYVECFLDMQELVTNKRISLSTFIKKILGNLYQ